MPNHCPARRRASLAALILVPALALSACGQSKEQIELDAKLARVEAAVQKAEDAQHAAEAAAARARSDKLASASHEVDDPAVQDTGVNPDIGGQAAQEPEVPPQPAPAGPAVASIQ